MGWFVEVYPYRNTQAHTDTHHPRTHTRIVYRPHGFRERPTHLLHVDQGGPIGGVGVQDPVSGEEVHVNSWDTSRGLPKARGVGPEETEDPLTPGPSHTQNGLLNGDVLFQCPVGVCEGREFGTRGRHGH